MVLVYDITAQPIAWSSLYILWLVALVVMFFAGMAVLSEPSSPGKSKFHMFGPYLVIGFAFVVASIGTVLGFANRTSCIAAADHAQSIEGKVHGFARNRSDRTNVRFRVEGISLSTKPGPILGCGFVASPTQAAWLEDGDYVRVAYDEIRILKLWKQAP